MDDLIQKFLDLLAAAPIIPILIAFTFLRRFMNKKPTGGSVTEPRRTIVPDDGYGRPQASTFDRPTPNPEFRDPSIDPAPSGSDFGGKYGTTKYGFDESEWGSTFQEPDEHDDKSRYSRR